MSKTLKIAVRKHKLSTYRNVKGEVAETTWYYTLAIRRYGFLWEHLKLFYKGSSRFFCKGVVRDILEDTKVYFNYTSANRATSFDTEEEAIRVKIDIIQHPDKYLTR